MTYEEWLANVPDTLTSDTLWRMEVYRLAVFLGDLSWHDASKLASDRRTLSLSDQFYRAVGGISATMSEGYSRASEKDQARFYEYSLGSAREARDWYYKGRFILGSAVATHRMQLLVHIIRLLLTIIPRNRGAWIREERMSYEVRSLQDILQFVPIPEESGCPT